MNTKLDTLGNHALLDLRLDKKALAFILDISTTTIEQLVRNNRLKGSLKGRKSQFSVGEAIKVIRAVEVRARRQDAALSGLELEIVRVALVEDIFVSGKIYFTKKRLALMCKVSLRTIEEWGCRGLVPVAKLLGRRNLYPALSTLFCLIRHRKISPNYLALVLWADRPRVSEEERVLSNN